MRPLHDGNKICNMEEVNKHNSVLIWYRLAKYQFHCPMAAALCIPIAHNLEDSLNEEQNSVRKLISTKCKRKKKINKVKNPLQTQNTVRSGRVKII